MKFNIFNIQQSHTRIHTSTNTIMLYEKREKTTSLYQDREIKLE
jgi:hypothetical protein